LASVCPRVSPAVSAVSTLNWHRILEGRARSTSGNRLLGKGGAQSPPPPAAQPPNPWSPLRSARFREGRARSRGGNRLLGKGGAQRAPPRLQLNRAESLVTPPFCSRLAQPRTYPPLPPARGGFEGRGERGGRTHLVVASSSSAPPGLPVSLRPQRIRCLSDPCRAASHRSYRSLPQSSSSWEPMDPPHTGHCETSIRLTDAGDPPHRQANRCGGPCAGYCLRGGSEWPPSDAALGREGGGSSVEGANPIPTSPHATHPRGQRELLLGSLTRPLPGAPSGGPCVATKRSFPRRPSPPRRGGLARLGRACFSVRQSGPHIGRAVVRESQRLPFTGVSCAVIPPTATAAGPRPARLLS